MLDLVGGTLPNGLPSERSKDLWFSLGRQIMQRPHQVAFGEPLCLGLDNSADTGGSHYGPDLDGLHI
jgi:hypothetical protein